MLILIAGVAGSSPVPAATHTTADQVAEMIDTIFANVPAGDQRSVVYKDNRERVYLAFYISTYADVKELRAYAITFRNVKEYPEEQTAIDGFIDTGNYAAAFDLLLGLMRLDLGAKYVSDVSLDGVHEGEVAVGEAHLQDRFHSYVFADHAAANAAYMHWLERAVALAQ